MLKSLKRFCISLLLGANLCTIVLMWLCVGLTYISPSILPRLSLLTLAFPVFLCINLLFTAFWLLFQARLTWVPLAGMLLVGSHIFDYTPLRIQSNDIRSDSTLTIISYNACFVSTNEKQEELIQFLTTADADIICLQEIASYFFDKHKHWLKENAYQVRQSQSAAILSRLPFLGDAIHIDYPTRSNNSFACWVNHGGDSLLVVNNHLESNQLSEEQKDDYAHSIADPNSQNIQRSSRMLIGKLSEAAKYRGAQTDSICSFVERHANHSVIVCGDLNETPISYTYQSLDRRLTSAYRKAGIGPGFTYSRRTFPVRIDHLFFSNDWTCTSCTIDKTVSASDHYPLLVRLTPKTQ